MREREKGNKKITRWMTFIDSSESVVKTKKTRLTSIFSKKKTKTKKASAVAAEGPTRACTLPVIMMMIIRKTTYTWPSVHAASYMQSRVKHHMAWALHKNRPVTASASSAVECCCCCCCSYVCCVDIGRKEHHVHTSIVCVYMGYYW